MVLLNIVSVGKQKEKWVIEAVEEYKKRLTGACMVNCIEIAEEKLPDRPGKKEIETALMKEGLKIARAVPPGTYKIALCVEGRSVSSAQFSDLLAKQQTGGFAKFCFIIGGSFGLSDAIKSGADYCLSLSNMTLPHHLARVVLFEQIYRAFSIAAGGRYHK